MRKSRGKQKYKTPRSDPNYWKQRKLIELVIDSFTELRMSITNSSKTSFSERKRLHALSIIREKYEINLIRHNLGLAKYSYTNLKHLVHEKE